ncbi:MAG: sensor domain-containing diguanylate cyclase [Mixta calida]|uniref:sensor domain-containing diguanylate cyclase n=1 Tax=Mixta calida TaxID=665913 RepID=UPI00290B6A76|nr:sensor domain-containing diguanylate cyclase [Mixta calida]MDU4942246.1 sensor domain-containing diguanylate cyclase [Mixta calida]
MLRLLRPKTDLRTLITLLAVASIVITLANSLYAAWRVQREQLITNTLEANRVYAAKLAATTGQFFQQAQLQLAWSAAQIGAHFDDETLLQTEVERLRQQTNSFNSVAVVDAGGWVRAISPESLMLKGMHLNSASSREALERRLPLIGQPSISAANNLIVFISRPVWSETGGYLGYVGGTLYLKRKSALNELLLSQFYRDGTQLYVLDRDDRVLYHQNSQLVGKKLAPLLHQEAGAYASSGYQEITNEKGEPVLAGYAHVPDSDWTIFAVKPTRITLAPLSSLLFQVVQHSLPLALLTLAAAWLLARLIALPLWHLARKASQMDEQNAALEINGVRSWYFEAVQIKRALLSGIGLLHNKIGQLKSEVQTDPLTQLLNRRGLHAVLEYFSTTRQPFAVLALDIDHFKRVNDTWGHDVGDRVIQQTARQLKSCARQTDVVCRSGGEEFLMILPGADEGTALALAERVRAATQQHAIEPVGEVTLSVGVSCWLSDSETLEESFRRADEALYRAKRAGRNCVVAASSAHNERRAWR